MPTTDDLALSPFPSILIVGDGGTGKTRVAGQFPKPYFFDFDKGMAVLRGVKGIVYDSFKEAPQNSKAFNPEKGIYEWGTAWPAFIKKLNDIGVLIDKGTCPYETLVFDSLTTLGNIAMSHVKRFTKEKGKWETNQAIDPGMWGAQSGLMETVVDQLTAWEIIKVMTAHVQRDTNELTQTIEMLPLTTGKWASKVSIYFDDVWYTSVKGAGNDAKVIIKCKPSAFMKQAKSRYNVAEDTELSWAAVKKYLRPNA